MSVSWDSAGRVAVPLAGANRPGILLVLLAWERSRQRRGFLCSAADGGAVGPDLVLAFSCPRLGRPWWPDLGVRPYRGQHHCAQDRSAKLLEALDALGGTG